VSFLPPGYSLVEVVPLGGAPGAYTYAVPPALAARARPGARVLIPFGARRRAGIVFGPATDSGEGKLREIEGVLDEEPMLSTEILALSKWAAEYYVSSLSAAIRSALPPGSDAEEQRHPVLSTRGIEALRTGAVTANNRRALRAIESGESQILAPGTLKRLVAEGLVELRREVKIGGEAPTIEVVVRLPDVPEPKIPAHHRSMKTAWALLTAEPRLEMSLLREQISSASEVVARLVKKGLVRVEQVARGSTLRSVKPSTPPILNEEQSAALHTLEAQLDAAEKKPFLLEGVTGSGKTEVYLHLIANAQQHGLGALVIVPEIALTPQLSSRFRARFGGGVAVLHSGLGDRDRAIEWHRIRRGEANIVVGARSAVFAPVNKLGVIVVDEEHDSSFKQAEGLRYHGRDLAVVRGRLAGAVVVLGSATPSLETVANAERGRYGHLKLTQRVDSRPMPSVELIDLRGRERKPIETAVQPSDLLTEQLVTGLQETVARQEQAIIFLNRRGHSTALMCCDCGHVAQCAQCAVAMTWHEKRRRLVCHYCGTREEAPEVCQACGSVRLLYSGAGTEKLEDELRAAVPGARVARLDRDTASTTRNLESVLAKFEGREIDLLIGTQMVAKGHDFPGVTLVCVLMADAGLHQPDFRAGERTAQLLNQVAGRAGRGNRAGRVLIQSFTPEAPAVRAVLTHDYATFARAELKERQRAGYPPHSRLCLVRMDGEDERRTSLLATEVAQMLVPVAGPELELLGPAPSPLSRLRGRYRYQILLKSPRHGPLHQAASLLARDLPRPPHGIRLTIDIDPVDML
jgi:primosomal protein N' (replication factor Y)